MYAEGTGMYRKKGGGCQAKFYASKSTVIWSMEAERVLEIRRYLTQLANVSDQMRHHIMHNTMLW